MSIHITHNFSALPFLAFFSCSFRDTFEAKRGREYNILIYFAMHTHQHPTSWMWEGTNERRKIAELKTLKINLLLKKNYYKAFSRILPTQMEWTGEFRCTANAMEKQFSMTLKRL